MAIDFPAAPTVGQSYTYNGLTWTWTGEYWNTESSDGGASISVGDTAPVSPTVGALWYDTTSGRLYTWYDTGWVEVTGAGPGASGGDSVPVGTVVDTIASVADAGWALFDGSTITNGQTIYPELWAKIPASMKSGANIVLPDARGKVIVMAGTGVGLTARALLATGGVETVTLTAVQSGIAAHTHTQAAHTHVQDAHLHTQGSHVHGNYVGWGAGTDSLPNWDGTSNKLVYGLATTGAPTTPTINSTTPTNQSSTPTINAVAATAAASAHENMAPWLALNKQIKLG